MPVPAESCDGQPIDQKLAHIFLGLMIPTAGPVLARTCSKRAPVFHWKMKLTALVLTPLCLPGTYLSQEAGPWTVSSVMLGLCR